MIRLLELFDERRGTVMYVQFEFRRCVLGACAAAAVLAGCTGAQQGAQAVPSGPSALNKTSAGQAHSGSLRLAEVTERVVYSFAGPPDGMGPSYGDLVDVKGTLYGTTLWGGARNLGTVFKTTTSGAESVLYSFKGSKEKDGSVPRAGLDKNARYGTTEIGGAYGYGTVFKITKSGTEKVLHSFAAGLDGSYPEADLLNVKGTLYGTTTSGGAPTTTGSSFADGTVFSITTSGTEKVLYRFAGPPNGDLPSAGLIKMSGKLYGTTQGGGAHGSGTVFSITTSGAEFAVYSFAGAPDGDSPYAGLINVNGTLFGTTYQGGMNYLNYGTVFKVTKSGTENVLYSFAGAPDGAYPEGDLINVNGTLYGTTTYGGASNLGTVFSITTSGTEKVLHSFAGTPDGANPESGLINVNGTLYGTTYQGGASDNGTVFSITP